MTKGSRRENLRDTCTVYGVIHENWLHLTGVAAAEPVRCEMGPGPIVDRQSKQRAR